jgi:hypothetical protein
MVPEHSQTTDTHAQRRNENMPNRKISNRVKAVVASGAMLSGLIGTAFVAPAANADVYSSYSLKIAAPGTQPVAPQFFEGFSNTINVAGSETAEYALEGVGNLYNNAGIFGCLQNSDKRTCSGVGGAGPFTPSAAYTANSDIYDNFDHDVVNNAQAVGSAAGVQYLCQTPAAEDPNEPASLTAGNGGVYPYWPYYTYPTPESTEGALGIPIDLVRASASIADLQNHVTYTVCSDLAQQGVASDAVIGLSFSPHGTTAGQLPDGTVVQDVAPPVLDFTNTGGVGSATDTAWRVFCDTSGSLQISTWDQLYALEGLSGAPTPDQPLVLWGPKNNSGTGATWYTFGGCGMSNGNIISDHTITENDAEQLSQYAAQNSAGSLPMNLTGCNSTTTPACGVGGSSGPTIPAAGSTITNPEPVDTCGGNGTATTGLGTSSYTAAAEKCVAQEVADSLFFMSYGYYVSHPFTAAVTIPTSTVGDAPNYIVASNYEAPGIASTIGGIAISGPNLGQPTAVTGDPRANNTIAPVQTGRDLWLDYLTDHVRASAAAFVNWVCDSGNDISPKGIDLTTGVPFDTEITQDVTNWGFGRLNCDGGVVGGHSPTFTTPITSAIIDPGPPNNE